jgi:hypothetical protein
VNPVAKADVEPTPIRSRSAFRESLAANAVNAPTAKVFPRQQGRRSGAPNLFQENGGLDERCSCAADEFGNLHPHPARVDELLPIAPLAQ